MHSTAYRGLNKHHKRVWSFATPRTGVKHASAVCQTQHDSTNWATSPPEDLRSFNNGHMIRTRICTQTRHAVWCLSPTAERLSQHIHSPWQQPSGRLINMYLGLTLWSDARFNQHIQFHGIITKESQTLAILRRNFVTRSKQLRASPANLCLVSSPIYCFFFSFLFFTFTFYNNIVPMGFLPLEIWVAFPGESQLRPNLQYMLGVLVFP